MDKGKIPVHWLSKEARFQIIDYLLATRSVKELANELGVSRTAIRKFINRETHPSDGVMERVFGILKNYEFETVMSIVVEDLLKALEMLISVVDETSDERKGIILGKLREVCLKIGK